MAREFVDRAGITFTMLWDESFESWRKLGIRAQPAATLYAADGTALGSWTGRFDEEEVLRLVDG